MAGGRPAGSLREVKVLESISWKTDLSYNVTMEMPKASGFFFLNGMGLYYRIKRAFLLIMCL